MSKVRLNITHPTSLVGTRTFNTKKEAQDFMAILYWFHSGVLSSIETEVPPLVSWVPGHADLLIIRAVLKLGNRVIPIQFARNKSGAGLKEAKDWIDEHFADDFVPNPHKY